MSTKTKRLGTTTPAAEVHASTSDRFSAGAGPIVLALHGYGSDERDLAALVDGLFPEHRWASLRAPIPTPNGGAAWFPIIRPGSPDAEPVEAATAAIWAWVDANVSAHTSVIPFGFSQGGLMATQLLRTRPEQVTAPVVLGGFTLGASQPGDATLLRTRPPLFWGRGEDDTVITPEALQRTDAWTSDHTHLSKRTYVGLGHGISSAELRDVRSFVLNSTRSAR